MAGAHAGVCRRRIIYASAAGQRGPRGGGCGGHNIIWGLKGREGRNAGSVLGWPKRCELARAFLWEYNYKWLKLAQLLGQLGVFLTREGFSAEQNSREWRRSRKRVREVSLFGKTMLWRHTLRTLGLTQARRAKEGVVSHGRTERESYRVGPKVASWPNIFTEIPYERPQVGPAFGPTL